MPSRSIRQRLASFWALDVAMKAMIGEAAIGLLAARVALKVRGFGRVSRRFGTYGPPTGAIRQRSVRPGETVEARIAWRVRRAIDSAVHLLPVAAVCLPQAMAAQVMLRRRGVGSVMHFAAALDQAALDAHAWLDAAGVPVTGYPLDPRQVEVASFMLEVRTPDAA